MKNKGFTLPEVLLAVVLLGVIGAIVLPNTNKMVDRAEQTTGVSAGEALERAVTRYELKYDVYPTDGVLTSIVTSETESIIKNELTRLGVDMSVYGSLQPAFKMIDSSRIKDFYNGNSEEIEQYFVVNRTSGISGYRNELAGYVFSFRSERSVDGDLISGGHSLNDKPSVMNVVPKQLKGISVEKNLESLIVQWSPDPRAQSYELLRDGVVVYNGATPSFKDQGLTRGVTYNYSLVAKNKNGSSTPAVFSGKTLLTSETQIQVGINHNLIKTNSGQMWSWGVGSDGELGQGASDLESSPKKIRVGTDWEQISSNGNISFGIKKDGSLWAWGVENNVRLGLNDAGDRDRPTPVGTATDWKSVSTSGKHTLAIKTNGTLWGWGENDEGQLGLGAGFVGVNQSTPIQIGSATNWSKISANGSHSLAIKTNGTLWSWGRGDGGALGSGTNADRPAPVQVGTATNWLDVFAGSGDTSGGIRTDRSLYVWGTNSDAQLGLGYKSASVLTPTRLGVANDWVFVDLSSKNGLGLKVNNTLWAWGDNSKGTLGQGSGDTADRSYPVQVSGAYKAFAQENQRVLAINSTGNLIGWGDASNNRLGNGLTGNVDWPTDISTTGAW